MDCRSVPEPYLVNTSAETQLCDSNLKLIDLTEINQTNVQRTKHIEAQKSEITTCDVCQRNYSNRQAWKKHIIRSHPYLYKKRIVTKTVECNNCSRKYSTQRALIRHIRISHPEEIKTETCCRKIIKTLECGSCGKKFSSRRALIRHWKQFHFCLILTEPNEKIWGCSECDKKYSNRFSLYKHKQLRHPNSNESIERRSKKIFECGSCDRKYSYKRALYRHVQMSHPEELVKRLTSKPITCDTCDKRFATKKYFSQHLRLSHSLVIQKKPQNRRKFTDYKCPLCQTSFKGKAVVLDHFVSNHNIDLVHDSIEFDTRADFDEWRIRVEETTKCSYSIGSSYAYADYRIFIYECSRSGHYHNKSTGVRSTQLKGTRKIGAYCPAQIRLKMVSSERCHVHFTSTHVGHTNELIYMRLNDRDRQSIAAQLTAGLPVNGVLRKFVASSSRTPCEELKRLNIVNADDVRNIRKKVERSLSDGAPRGWLSDQASLSSETNVDGGLPHLADIADVETWIKQNADTLLYVKRAGVVDVNEIFLNRDDFAFVLMTNAQKVKIASLGNDIVCVQDVFEPPKHIFRLTMLLVLDQQGRSYVCALMLSNRNDFEVYELFFCTVRRAVPSVRPRILIGPVSDAFDVAWESAMGCPTERRLYSVWHVLQIWRSHVSLLVKNVAMRRQLNELLERLLYEPDEDKFFCELDMLTVRLEGEKLFRSFFDANYASCVERWAYCCAGINANTVLEAFHHKFGVSSLLRRCKRNPIFHDDKNTPNSSSLESNRELLDVLTLIRDLIGRQEYEESVLVERGLIQAKLRNLRYRHRRIAYDFENVCADESGTQWLVISSGRNYDLNGCGSGGHQAEHRVFVVEKVEKECVDCKLICEPCGGVCVHDYECSCIDARLRKNMCSHIHLVCQFGMRNRKYGRVGCPETTVTTTTATFGPSVAAKDSNKSEHVAFVTDTEKVSGEDDEVVVVDDNSEGGVRRNDDHEESKLKNPLLTTTAKNVIAEMEDDSDSNDEFSSVEAIECIDMIVSSVD